MFVCAFHEEVASMCAFRYARRDAGDGKSVVLLLLHLPHGHMRRHARICTSVAHKQVATLEVAVFNHDVNRLAFLKILRPRRSGRSDARRPVHKKHLQTASAPVDARKMKRVVPSLVPPGDVGARPQKRRDASTRVVLRRFVQGRQPDVIRSG
jgi:hypothetical protein